MSDQDKVFHRNDNRCYILKAAIVIMIFYILFITVGIINYSDKQPSHCCFVIARASVESFPGTNSSSAEPGLVIDPTNNSFTVGEQDNMYHFNGIQSYLFKAALAITMIWILFIAVCVTPRTKHVPPFIGTPYFQSGWEIQQLQKEHTVEFHVASMQLEDRSSLLVY